MERAQVRITPHCVQIAGEDGVYDAPQGFQIEALVPCHCGDAQYTYQGTFTESQANAELERLCGEEANGFHAEIDTLADPRWLFTGASY